MPDPTTREGPHRVRRAILVAPATPMAPFRPARPIGVMIIAILTFLGALGFVAGGVVILVALAVGQSFLGFLPAWLHSTIALIGAIIAVFLFLFAIVSFIVAWGEWAGRPWAWTLTIVLSLLGLFLSGFQLIALLSMLGQMGAELPIGTLVSAFLSCAMDVLIVWYFYTPGVKAFFGKSHMRALWQRAPHPAG